MYQDLMGEPIINLSKIFGSVVNKYAGTGLTDAEKEANAFSSEEAQKSRDWTEYMTRNKYQMETQSMEQAGLNPAMVYGGGQLVPTASNGATASSTAPSSGELFDLISTLVRLPSELKVLASEASRNEKEGDAAIMNARSNERNASSNEFNAETNRMRQEVDAYVARYDVDVKEATKDNLAANTAYLLKTTSQLDERLSILHQQANAQEKQAIAALQSSLAALRNAAVNEKLSDVEVEVKRSQILVNWAAKDGQIIVNKNLDAKMQNEIQELASRSHLLSASAEVQEGQKKLQWMQTITGYTNAACNIVNTGLGVATGLPSHSNPIGF